MNALTTEQMAAMDDVAEYGQRVSERDLHARIAEKRASTSATSASEWSSPHRLHDWTEILPETCATKPRMGPLMSIERRLLQRRPTYTWAAVVLFALFAAVVRGCA